MHLDKALRTVSAFIEPRSLKASGSTSRLRGSRRRLRIVCDTWSWCALASPGALPTRLKTMRDLFSRLVLPDQRRSRRYPPAAKIRMSNYPRKRPTHARS
jgi:hypothetical protein